MSDIERFGPIANLNPEAFITVVEPHGFLECSASPEGFDHYRSVDGRPTLWNRVFFPDPNPFPRIRLWRRK